MPVVFHMAVKDLRILIGDKMGFFFIFIFPLAIAIFFGSIFSGSSGGDGSIAILVVDEDQTDGSRAFIATLEQAEELAVTRLDRQAAEMRVRQGKSTAYIALMPGFGAARQRVFWGGAPRIELGVDPARKAEAGMIQGILTKYAVDVFRTMFSDRDSMLENITNARNAAQAAPDWQGRDALLALFADLERFVYAQPAGAESEDAGGFNGFKPLEIENVPVLRKRKWPTNAYGITFPQGIVWGIIGCAAGFGISLVVERQRGTLLRLRCAPLSRGHILAGKALACFMTIIAMSLVLLAMGRLVFGIRPNSIPLLALAVLCAALAFVGIMMLLSVLGRTEQAAGGIGWAVMLTMAMVGGGSLPLFIMPKWMQSVSSFSPVKWAILALEGAIWRGFTPREMAAPCLILLGVGVVAFTIGVRLFRWSEAR